MGGHGARGEYASAGGGAAAFVNNVWAVNNTATEVLQNATDQVICETSAISGTYLALFRGMVSHSVNNDRVRIEWFAQNSDDDPIIFLRGDTHNLSASDGLIGGSSIKQDTNDYDNDTIGVYATEQDNAGEGWANHCAAFGLDLNGLTKGTDYLSPNGVDANCFGVSANTDTEIVDVSLDIQETGNHLVFWSLWMNAAGQAGRMNYWLEIGSDNVYNRGTGFRWSAENAFDDEGSAGCFIYNFTSTGAQNLEGWINVDAGFAGTDASIRLRAFAIPVSKFANVYSATSTSGTSVGSTTYTDATGFSISNVDTNGNPALVMCSSSTAPDSASGIRGKFTSDGSEDLSAGDDYGTLGWDDDSTGSTQDSKAHLNFVYLSGGIDNSTIAYQIAQNPDDNAADVSRFNRQGDGSTSATGYLIVIELASP